MAASDAWRNVMLSLYFLQGIGDALADVFVCFGNTVKFPTNVRKLSTSSVAMIEDPFQRRRRRPYTLRNLAFQCQYMFRLIDGLFCDNYGTRLQDHQETYKELRHGPILPYRQRALAGPDRVEARRFSPRVCHVKLSPGMRSPDLSALLATADREPAVVLVEAYGSGGFPTRDEHAFARTLQLASDQGIPIVSVSPAGQSGSHLREVPDTRGVPEPLMLRLYNVIEETAHPLLCLALDRISADAWGRASGKDALRRRTDLLSKAIRALLEEQSTGGLTLAQLEMQAITDPLRDHERFRKTREAADARREERSRAMGKLALVIAKSAGASSQPEVRPLFGLRRFAEEVVRPYENAGARPDGLDVLSRMGLELGWASLSNTQAAVRPPSEVAAHQLAAHAASCTRNLSLHGPAKEVAARVGAVEDHTIWMELTFAKPQRSANSTVDVWGPGGGPRHSRLWKSSDAVLEAEDWFLIGFFKGLFLRVLYRTCYLPDEEPPQLVDVPGEYATPVIACRVMQDEDATRVTLTYHLA